MGVLLDISLKLKVGERDFTLLLWVYGKFRQV